MKKESLIEARELIIETLRNSKIDDDDKRELMWNIGIFLNHNHYENDLKTLIKTNNKNRIRQKFDKQ